MEGKGRTLASRTKEKTGRGDILFLDPMGKKGKRRGGEVHFASSLRKRRGRKDEPGQHLLVFEKEGKLSFNHSLKREEKVHSLR